MDQFSAAAIVEKDQRDSLSQLTRARADFRRTVRRSGGSHARLDRDSEHVGRHIVVLILAAYRIRHMEIRYGSD